MDYTIKSSLPATETFPSQLLGDYIAHFELDGVVDAPLIGQTENRDPDDWDTDPLCDIHVSRLDLSETVKDFAKKSEVSIQNAPAAAPETAPAAAPETAPVSAPPEAAPAS